jgi:hypothetical protein
VSLADRRAHDKRGVDALFDQPDSVQAPAPEKKSLAKVTLYVRPDQVDSVEDIQQAERKRTGKKPDKSDLYQEALDLLIDKYKAIK